MSKRTSSSNVNKILPDKFHFTKSRKIMVFTELCYNIIDFIPLRFVLISFRIYQTYCGGKLNNLPGSYQEGTDDL